MMCTAFMTGGLFDMKSSNKYLNQYRLDITYMECYMGFI